MHVTGSGSGMFMIREGRNKDAGAFPVLDRFSYSETWTNAETGEWFLIRGHVLFNEVEATRVEGPIFEFRFVEAGGSRSSGSRTPTATSVERNSGSVHVTYLFDTLGDNEPGGEWIADLTFPSRRPTPKPRLAPVRVRRRADRLDGPLRAAWRCHHMATA